jgi:hypothetical protein
LILERLLGQGTPPPTAFTSMQRLYPENERFRYRNLGSASGFCSPNVGEEDFSEVQGYYARRLFLLTHDQHRAMSVADDGVGDAAHQRAPQGPEATASQNDEPRAKLIG